MGNVDQNTVNSFGDEWSRFDQSGMTQKEATKTFEEYFSIFPWETLSASSEGFDMGCGSGRWARFVAPRVGLLHCVDPSSALDVAKVNLAEFDNVNFHQGTADASGLAQDSQDFGYSLGVLHHVPDTRAAIRSCVALLKPGAPLLLYLYYAFDNRPLWFRVIWTASDLLRGGIYRLPPYLKHITTDILAALIYWPLARLSAALDNNGHSVKNIPLSYYRHHSFYTMRTDARDRFGTPLEQRFTRNQIESMMRESGLRDIRFSENAPFWCAIGYKAL